MIDSFELKKNFELSLLKTEYSTLFIFIVVSICLSFIIIFASYFLSKQNPDSEKLSAYECGFEPYEDTRHVFDVRFCVVAVIFIVFDIEIMYLIPWTISLSKLDLMSFWVVIDFLLELVVGFYYVWYAGGLTWN